MKNLIAVLLVISTLVFIKCDYSGISGTYTVITDSPAIITYTNESGEDVTITSSNFVYNFTLPDNTDMFYHKIYVRSLTGKQNIYISVIFNEAGESIEEFGFSMYMDNWENSLYYCSKYSNKCATVNVGY